MPSDIAIGCDGPAARLDQRDGGGACRLGFSKDDGAADLDRGRPR